MNPEDEFACLVNTYFGVREMDHYPLKEYVMHDLQVYLENFVANHEISLDHLEQKIDDIISKSSLKRKLQDALIMLPRIQASMEFILLVKDKIRELSEN